MAVCLNLIMHVGLMLLRWDPLQLLASGLNGPKQSLTFPALIYQSWISCAGPKPRLKAFNGNDDPIKLDVPCFKRNLPSLFVFQRWILSIFQPCFLKVFNGGNNPIRFHALSKRWYPIIKETISSRFFLDLASTVNIRKSIGNWRLNLTAVPAMNFNLPWTAVLNDFLRHFYRFNNFGVWVFETDWSVARRRRTRFFSVFVFLKNKK